MSVKYILLWVKFFSDKKFYLDQKFLFDQRCFLGQVHSLFKKKKVNPKRNWNKKKLWILAWSFNFQTWNKYEIYSSLSKILLWPKILNLLRPKFLPRPKFAVWPKMLPLRSSFLALCKKNKPLTKLKQTQVLNSGVIP